MAFEYGNSTFKDSQTVVLQNSLVASDKPGDRVQMIGIYKLISGMNTK